MKLVQFPRSRFRSTLRLTIASVWPLAYLLPPQSLLIASEPLAKGIRITRSSSKKRTTRSPAWCSTVVAQLKEQAAQIQKVSAQVEVNKPTPRVVVNKPQNS